MNGKPAPPHDGLMTEEWMLSNFLITCVDVSHLQIIPQQFTHGPERRKLSPVSVAVQLAKDMMSESAVAGMLRGTSVSGSPIIDGKQADQERDRKTPKKDLKVCGCRFTQKIC